LHRHEGCHQHLIETEIQHLRHTAQHGGQAVAQHRPPVLHIRLERPGDTPADRARPVKVTLVKTVPVDGKPAKQWVGVTPQATGVEAQPLSVELARRSLKLERRPGDAKPQAGLQDAKIMATGDLDEFRIREIVAAEAAFLRTSHGPRVEEIAIAVANVNLADARAQEADKSYQRTQQLREGVTVTRVQIDQAQRDARIAAALLEEVRAKLALLQAGSREEDITEARSRRDAAGRN
jgi:hypothetical protein